MLGVLGFWAQPTGTAIRKTTIKHAGRQEHAGWQEQVKAAASKSAAICNYDPRGLARLSMAVLKTESSGRPEAVSLTGAVGLMQLEPATAKSLGVNPADPRENIQGGVRYLAMLLRRFQGSVPMALAGYNAGPTLVARYGQVPPVARVYVTAVFKNEGG